MTGSAGAAPNTATFRRSTTEHSDGTLSKVVIEASQPIVLTADPHSTDSAALVLTGHVTHDLEVYADEVTIQGHLQFPSRSVTIVARVVHGALAADGTTGPMLDVAGLDGAKPADKLALGLAPPNSGKTKLAQGPTAAAGSIHVWYPVPDPGAKDSPGANGAFTPPEEINGEPGTAGDPGKPGGSVTIIADQVTGPVIALRAYGGQGGDGQDGQDGGQGGTGGRGADAAPQHGSEFLGFGLATPGGSGGTGGTGGDGGAGGPGGDGGHVVARWARGEAARPFTYSNWAGAAGHGGAAGWRGTFGDAGAGGRGHDARLGAIVTGLMLVADPGLVFPEWVHGQTPLSACEAYQDDAPSGALGTWGQPGTKGGPPTVTPTEGTAQLRPSTGVPAITAELVHDTYVQMLFDRARATWLARLGDKTPRSESDDVGALLSWLFAIVEAMSDSAPDNLLVQGIHQEVWAARSNYLAGQDYFGNPPHYVPLLSLDTLFTSVDGAAANLARLEGAVNRYDTALAANTSALESAKGTLAEAQSAATYLQAKVDDITSNLIGTKIMPRLQLAEDARQASSDALVTVLEDFVKETQSAFGLNPAQLLNALSTMAFSLGDAASFATQAASQIGTLALDASKNVIDDAGDSVSKAFVVTSVRSLEDGDLKATLTATADGFKDPSSSYSLLVGLGQVRTLVDNFRNSSEAASAAAEGVDDYIRAIQHRNNVVGEYNAAVRQLLDLRGAQQRAAAQIASTGQDIERGSDPGLAAIDSYMRGLHARAQTEALRELMLVSQAASLFELAEVPLTTFGGNPGLFDSVVILAAKSTLQTSIDASLDTIRTVLAPFPMAEDAFSDDGVQWYSLGVLVVLTPERHPEVFDSLTMLREATFELDPPVPPTTRPTEIDEPTWAAHGVARSDHSTSHPFHRKANVRLSRLRVFAEGLTGSPLITLTHRGTERFVTSSGTIFPGTAAAPAVAWHEPVVLGHQYEAQYYQFDRTRGFDARAVRFGSSTDFGDLNASDAMKEVKYAYASIGPFGAWTISFEEDVDVSSITRIIIDFHGHCELMPDS